MRNTRTISNGLSAAEVLLDQHTFMGPKSSP